MRTLTMNEVQDVNGSGVGESIAVGLFVSMAWDGIKAGFGALSDQATRNNPSESPGSFYDLHF
jgi:hypothetical protein